MAAGNWAHASDARFRWRRHATPTQAVTAAYEAAAAAKPADPALQDALFGAYVRERQLVKQQQARQRAANDAALLNAQCVFATR